MSIFILYEELFENYVVRGVFDSHIKALTEKANKENSDNFGVYLIEEWDVQ